MKKTIVELFFLDKKNATYVSSDTPRFVYWHCSTLPPYKFERLTEKLKIGLPRFFVSALSYVLTDFFGNIKFELITKINDGEPQLWSSVLAKETFRKINQQVKKTKSKKNLSASFIAEFPFKIEIKIIKYRVVFGLHYPENYYSERVSIKILQALDKFLRNLFKAEQI